VYRFPESINYDQFFRFDRRWIKEMQWARLPKSSKSVLPVIAIHCDKKGRCFPGESTIAILSGLSDKTVRGGIQGLTGFPGFELSYHVNEKGKRAKCFRLILPPRGEKKRSFFFYKCIVEGGNWQELKQFSHALYPVMRYFSRFDKGEGVGSTDEDFQVSYREREWEICEATINTLARYAGISRPSVYEALRDLEEKSLIEPQGTNDEGIRTWRVFLKPPKYYNREYLNARVKERDGTSGQV
jgi:hypothetical protein